MAGITRRVREMSGGILLPVREAGGPGHWVTLKDGDVRLHMYVNGKGVVERGPARLIGASLKDLEALPGRDLHHHPAGHTPDGHDSHPEYQDDAEQAPDDHKAPSDVAGTVDDHVADTHARRAQRQVTQQAQAQRATLAQNDEQLGAYNQGIRSSLGLPPHPQAVDFSDPDVALETILGDARTYPEQQAAVRAFLERPESDQLPAGLADALERHYLQGDDADDAPGDADVRESAPSYEGETAAINERSKTPAAQRKHKFQAAHWTFKNGHPRCRLCGDEEMLGGYCNDDDESDPDDGKVVAVEDDDADVREAEEWRTINGAHIRIDADAGVDGDTHARIAQALDKLHPQIAGVLGGHQARVAVHAGGMSRALPDVQPDADDADVHGYAVPATATGHVFGPAVAARGEGYTALHELGHILDEKSTVHDRTITKTRRSDWADFDALWRDQRNNDDWPTLYRGSREMFAHGFAEYHLHPDALKKVAPALYDFFRSLPQRTARTEDDDGHVHYAPAAAPSVREAGGSTDGDGHWVTLHHSGAHVYIEDGRVTKGPAPLVNRPADEALSGELATHHAPGHDLGTLGTPSTAEQRGQASARGALVPPRSWSLWLNPDPDGKVQATWLDAKGRKQYGYHPSAVVARDAKKFGAVQSFSQVLPRLVEQVNHDLSLDDSQRARVAAAAVALIAQAHIRVGSEKYAQENGTFGVSSLRGEHVRVEGDTIALSFTGKHHVDHEVQVQDGAAAQAIAHFQRLTSTDERVFRYRDGDTLRPLGEQGVNDYLRAFGVTAKQFRTHYATRTAAELLAEAGPPASEADARKTITRVVAQIAEHLGNTPAVCRSSYINPAVLDAYSKGELMGTQEGAGA